MSSLEAKMDRVLQVLERLAPGQVPLPLPVPLLQANLQDEGKEESVGDFTSKEGTPAKEHTNTPKSAAKKEGDSCESTEKVDPKKPPIPQQGTPKQFENPRAPEPLLGVTPGDDSTQAFSNRKEGKRDLEQVTETPIHNKRAKKAEKEEENGGKEEKKDDEN